jgi:hypothetical protein
MTAFGAPRLDDLDVEFPRSEGSVTSQADYWIEIYSLLFDHHERALERAQESVLSEATEVQFIRSGLDALMERLAFWRIRRGQDWLGSRD